MCEWGGGAERLRGRAARKRAHERGGEGNDGWKVMEEGGRGCNLLGRCKGGEGERGGRGEGVRKRKVVKERKRRRTGKEVMKGKRNGMKGEEEEEEEQMENMRE